MRDATITVPCSECLRQVELYPSDITLYWTSSRRAVTFTCPGCGADPSWECGSWTASALARVGVRIVDDGELPDWVSAGYSKEQPNHYPEDKNVMNVNGDQFPVFTLDDAIDFHYGLDAELEELFK